MKKQEVVNEIINRIDSYYILDSVLDKLTSDEQKTLVDKKIDVRIFGEVWYKLKEHIQKFGTLPGYNDLKHESVDDIRDYVDLLKEIIGRLKQEMIETVKNCFDNEDLSSCP